MNRRDLLAAALAAPALTAFRPPVAGGTLVELTQMTSAHVAPRDVTVWLPPGYETGADRHPVLYMHDGQNLFDPARALRRVGNGRASGAADRDRTGARPDRRRRAQHAPAPARIRARPMIAALPGEVRADLIGLYGGEPLSDGYLAFLTGELKPLVDRTWRTLPGRDDTAIMGSSMGGLISLYAMMQRPEVFGAAGCVSTHWPLRIERLDEGRLEAWREVVVRTWSRVVRDGLPDPATHRLYMDRGDETLDQFYPFFQSRIDQVIRDAGWGPDRFRSLVFPGAAHDEPSWNRRLDVPLTFLLPPVS
jgi:hypothetical protein